MVPRFFVDVDASSRAPGHPTRTKVGVDVDQEDDGERTGEWGRASSARNPRVPSWRRRQSLDADILVFESRGVCLMSDQMA